jgi:hypothetical protein
MFSIPIPHGFVVSQKMFLFFLVLAFALFFGFRGLWQKRFPLPHFGTFPRTSQVDSVGCPFFLPVVEEISGYHPSPQIPPRWLS